MPKLVGIVVLLTSLAGLAMAGGIPAAPEISPASGASALVLLAGALLVIRGRRKK